MKVRKEKAETGGQKPEVGGQRSEVSHRIFTKEGHPERVVIPVRGNRPLKLGLLLANVPGLAKCTLHSRNLHDFTVSIFPSSAHENSEVVDYKSEVNAGLSVAWQQLNIF
ncbi:MAG: type II toxin-antitoxin system HicA family toxin [Verrucomicrobia bacterium]|nr:type II toxin-antitoxin system HicA family toxin [Verrucomicrobiota bacterium]